MTALQCSVFRASALIALLSSGLAGAQVRLPSADAPLILPAGRDSVRVELVAGGLVAPWDIEVLPDGRTMIVAESPGRLRMIRDGELLPDILWQSPSPESNDVLHGVVAHPEFERNGLLYMAYLKEGADGLTIAVSRGRLDGNRVVAAQEIFVADAWGPGNGVGGRMLFGPDQSLYLTIGDRDNLCCGPVDDNSIRIQAQSLDTHIGKTLRLTDTGEPAPDNPFIGQAGARPEIYSYGHRNGHGLDFHPETGELWQQEIGPMGGDEINILQPGANYGWPLVSMGRNYSGTLVSEQPFSRPGMEDPRMFWVPAISPSAIMFYTGELFADWQGSLFVTGLSGKQVQRVSFGRPGQAEQRQVMLTELDVRFRDVAQDADGYIYFATENRYGGGEPSGTIIRIAPAE